ncbi:MAG TPA: helix-turn-helix transcriptional regulator [Streptosporangiaceae bacterium]|nr:helix-turn-helix transcriptional regulator [Streptosporangiaceae bacterium]
MGSDAAYARARAAIAQVCRGDADARTLRLEVLAAIRRAVGFDAYAWLITDPETSVGSSPLADVPCLPDLPRLIRLKYLTGVNRWTGLARGAASLSAATGGELSRSLMWRELLHRYQVSDIASSVYRDRFGCWGFLDLWRIQAPPFPAAGIEFLDGIAGPVTTALRHSQAMTFTPATGAGPLPAGPVVLLLSAALEVRAQTPQTQRYLRVLVPRDDEDQAPVPASAYNVAAQLIAAETGVDDGPPLARVHLASGRWLTLRAARMGTAGPARERDIAVSIEPAAPADRVSVFARACGLTPREAELLQQLVTGAATRDIAQAMFVSEHTVQDHFKSIFAKTATRNRRTLLARALGT